MKRLFFALWPNDSVRDALTNRTRKIVTASGGRAVYSQNLHITLAFLHNVDTKLLPCIADAAQRARSKSFILTVDRVGYWPRSKILWIAPSRMHPTLAELVERLWQALGECGFTPERRRYTPHITLARNAIEPVSEDNVKPILWPVTNFALIESITGQKQSTYSVLANWPLL